MKKLLNFCLIGMLFGFSTGLMAQSPVITEDKPVYGVEQMPQFSVGDEESMKFILQMAKDSSVSKEPLLIVDGIQRPYSLLKDPIQFKQLDIKSAGNLSDADATALYGDKGKNGVILITTKNGAAKQDSVKSADTPVYGVETMPQFPGGDDALMKFIKRNLRYPTSEVHKRIQGRTVIKFVIDKTGKVCDVTVARSLSAECDAEAVRVVKLMPNWKPLLPAAPPTFEMMPMSRPVAVGKTQASSVNAALKSSDALSGTLTVSLLPSNVSAVPVSTPPRGETAGTKRVGAELPDPKVASSPAALASRATLPAPSLKFHQPATPTALALSSPR